MPRFGRLPLGLMGMVVAISVIETAVSRRAIDLSPTASWSWRLSTEAARREARGRPFLFLGDSLIKHGLMPAVVSERAGQPCYNLAVPAAQPITTYYLIAHALAAGGRPRAIIVDASSDLLAGGPEHNLRNWPELLTLSETIALAWHARDAAIGGQIILAKCLPTYKCRFEAREAFFAALRGEDNPHRALNQMGARNWLHNLGAHFVPANPGFDGTVTAAEHARLLSDRFWCHPLEERYLDKLLDLAQRFNVQVYWLLPPAAPRFQQRRDESGSARREEQFWARIQSRHPQLIVLDARHSDYENAVFQDPIHLAGPGSLALSDDVGEVLMARDASSRWIVLPKYRPRSAPASLEDVNQSRLAIEAEEHARR